MSISQMLGSEINPAATILQSSVSTCGLLTSNTFIDSCQTPQVDASSTSQYGQVHVSTAPHNHLTPDINSSSTPHQPLISTQSSALDQFHAPIYTHPPTSSQQYTSETQVQPEINPLLHANTQFQSIPTSESFQSTAAAEARLSPVLCPTSTDGHTPSTPLVHSLSIANVASPLTTSIPAHLHLASSTSANSSLPSSTSSLVAVNCLSNSFNNLPMNSSTTANDNSPITNSSSASIPSPLTTAIVNSPLQRISSPRIESPQQPDAMKAPSPLTAALVNSANTAVTSPNIAISAVNGSTSVQPVVEVNAGQVNNTNAPVSMATIRENNSPNITPAPQQQQLQGNIIPANKLIENLLKNQSKANAQFVSISHTFYH